MRDTSQSLRDIAEDIGVSENTLYNALHQRTDLSAAFLAELGRVYGGSFLNPYCALFYSTAQPIQGRATDILPTLTDLTHEIAMSRHPESPGGTAEVPQERKRYLAKAKRVEREVGCLIREIECV
jgi:hypothetical protein